MYRRKNTQIGSTSDHFCKVRTIYIVEATENTITDMNITNEYRNRRKYVTDAEAIVAQYLDESYYKLWSNSVERCNEKALQVQGLDLTALSGTTPITIDEKASVLWSNKRLTTFAQEISAINIDGEEYDGWLLNFNSVSDYLLYVWIDAANTPLRSPADILDATVALVKKCNLWYYLRVHDIYSTELRELARDMRKKGTRSTTYKGYKVVHQTNKQEHAVSILIPRTELIGIATHAARIKMKQ